MPNTKIHVELRQGARQILSDFGIPSNPATGDEWIVNKFRELADLKTIEGYEEIEEDDTVLLMSSLANVIKELGGNLSNARGEGELKESVEVTNLLNALSRTLSGRMTAN